MTKFVKHPDPCAPPWEREAMPDPNPPGNAAYWKRRATKAEAQVEALETFAKSATFIGGSKLERIKELEDALALIKLAVCGDAYPCWSDGLAVTHSRGRIADICDAPFHPKR